jgi:hypothetical protein
MEIKKKKRIVCVRARQPASQSSFDIIVMYSSSPRLYSCAPLLERKKKKKNKEEFVLSIHHGCRNINGRVPLS